MDNHNQHATIKTILKVLGGIFLPLGIILLLCGTIPFFNGDTSTFHLNFIAMPLLFVGAVCLMFGFQQEMNRYVSDENKPVAKDFANYMLDGTRQETVKTVQSIRAVGRICNKCGTQNEPGAKFCDHCGEPLVKICENCGENNDGDANFCRNCGKKL